MHARMAYPLKSRLGVVSTPVYGLNFWSRLYDILGSITWSKNTLGGSKGLKIGMIRSWNISWAESSVVDTAVDKPASNISKVSFLHITK